MRRPSHNIFWFVPQSCNRAYAPDRRVDQKLAPIVLQQVPSPILVVKTWNDKIASYPRPIHPSGVIPKRSERSEGGKGIG